MGLELRKIVTIIEETMIEGGKAADTPLTMVAVAAILRNPWAGKPFTADLQPKIRAIAPKLGVEMVRRLTDIIPGERVEAYDKAAAFGVAGEIEHGSALIHTLRFGNIFRDAVEGTSYQRISHESFDEEVGF